MKIGFAVIVACPNFLFSTFYRPPNADEWFLVNFKEFLAKYSLTGSSNVIVTGDFKFPHVNCNTCSLTPSDVGTGYFCYILNDHFLLKSNLNPM